jgi:hypothetical protein
MKKQLTSVKREWLIAAQGRIYCIQETHIHHQGSKRRWTSRCYMYVTDLKQNAASCDSKDLQCSLIRHRIVCGIWSDPVRKRLLRDCLFVLSRTSNFSAIWRLSPLPVTGLCLALTAFSSEGSSTCHTYCDTGPPFLRSYLKESWFSLLNAVLLAKEQSLPILNFLSLTRPARAGLELTTSRMLRKSTTTSLPQPVDYRQRKTLYHRRL